MFDIDTAKCTGCGACVTVCAAGAVTLDGVKAAINHRLCVECGDCCGVCPTGAILETVRVPQHARDREGPASDRERKEVVAMPFGRGWFGRGGGGRGRGMGFGRGMGMGRGNPYPFCRFNPALPRRWWARGGGQYPPAPQPGYGWDPYRAGPMPYRRGW
jgi:NAD-dependent dihydropyrimidine dehydrogenase PreA subunit